MRPGDFLNRRFLFGVGALCIITAVNVGLYLYWKDGELFAPEWSYVVKSDDTILFGRIELLEGGFVELKDVYTLVLANHLQGESAGGDFRLESLNEQQFTLAPAGVHGHLRIGPLQVKQWGEVPSGSTLDRQLDALYLP